MTYDEVSRSLRIFFGAREGLRRLGFKADDLYCVTGVSAEDGEMHVICSLRTQCRTFDIDCGVAEKSDVEMLKEYDTVAEAINSRSMPEVDLGRFWEECGLIGRVTELLLALRCKGFRIPATVGHLN